MIEVTDEHFKECLNHLAGTHEGQVVLFMLMEECHWNLTLLASDNPQATQYHAARRGVYGGLRKTIRPEYLKVIEFDFKRQARADSRIGRKDRPSGGSNG